jgi:hypothetical protein
LLSWCTPAWPAGSPACQADVHQHGWKDHLLAKLVYASMAIKQVSLFAELV